MRYLNFIEIALEQWLLCSGAHEQYDCEIKKRLAHGCIRTRSKLFWSDGCYAGALIHNASAELKFIAACGIQTSSKLLWRDGSCAAVFMGKVSAKEKFSNACGHQTASELL